METQDEALETLAALPFEAPFVIGGGATALIVALGWLMHGSRRRTWATAAALGAGVSLGTALTGEASPGAMWTTGLLVALPLLPVRDRRLFAMSASLPLGLAVWPGSAPLALLAPALVGASLDERRPTAPLLHLLAAFGIWATVPDTEVAEALLAASLVVALAGGAPLGTPIFMGLAAWAILRGARGRPPTALFAALELVPLIVGLGTPRVPAWAIGLAQALAIALGVYLAHQV